MLIRERPAFRLLWTARAVSSLGDGVSTVTLTLLVLPDGPTAVAVLLLVGALPRLLGPVTGVLADVLDPRVVLLGSALVGAAVLGTVATVDLSRIPLLCLVAAASLAATCFGPAYRRLVPELVDEAHLPEANAWNGAATQLSLLLGAAGAGLLVAVMSPRSVLLVDAASFLVAAGLIARLPRTAPRARGGLGVGAEVRAGLAFARTDRTVRALLLGMLLLVGFVGIDNVALVFLVTVELGAGTSAYGVLSAVGGLAMVTTSVVLLRRRAVDPVRLLLLGSLLSSAGAALIGLAPGLLTLAVALACAGSGNAVVVLGAEGLLQRAVPRELLGRVGGAYQASTQLAFVLAYAAGGPLLAALGPRPVFLVAAAGSLLALLVFRPALRPSHR